MPQKRDRPALLQAMIDAFHLPDLRRRILFTLGILVIFRFIAHIPMPIFSENLDALDKLFDPSTGAGGLLGMLDLFSGGGMKSFSIVALGVYPYITASIIMQLLVPVIPQLQRLSQEGEEGRNRINLITHWLTVPLAALQGYGQYFLIRSQLANIGVDIGDTSALTIVAMIVTLSAGTIFLVWLGELITERGIGNGVSMIIFAGIIAGLPEMVGRGELARQENLVGLIGFILLSILTILLIVVFTEAHRRIPVHYSRSVFRGRRMYKQSGSTHIPLRVNTAGMIPLIFAMSMMIMPGVIASYFADSSGFVGSVANFFVEWSNNWSYWLVYFLLVIGFAFFYTMVMFEQMNLVETLKKQGGFIPGIRPGRATETYLNQVMLRITWGGALFLALVAVMPFIAQLATGVQVLALQSTAMLIMVGVALDTMKQLESQLLMRRYEGFLK